MAISLYPSKEMLQKRKEHIRIMEGALYNEKLNLEKKLRDINAEKEAIETLLTLD